MKNKKLSQKGKQKTSPTPGLKTSRKSSQKPGSKSSQKQNQSQSQKQRTFPTATAEPEKKSQGGIHDYIGHFKKSATQHRK